MRAILLIPVAAALLLTGCGQSSSSSPSATSTTNNAQVGNANYGGVLGQAQTFSENQIDLAQLKQAIQEFNAAEGRYPKNLQEMIPNYLARIPATPAGYRISYNPANGQVQVVRQ